MHGNNRTRNVGSGSSGDDVTGDDITELRTSASVLGRDDASDDVEWTTAGGGRCPGRL